jgi:hypothetical protein
MDHSNIALADLDNDNDLEIIFEYGLKLYAMHDNGLIIFSDSSVWVSSNPPVIGDINNDSFPDIIVNSEDSVYALNASGVILPGFPKPMSPYSVYTYPAIDDIDNDGKVEVISSSNWIEPEIATGIIYVWELDSDYNQSTMQWQMYQHDPQHTGYYHNGIPVGISDESQAIIQSMFLSQNYPNPFNPSTTIKYSVPELSFVKIKVFNLLGQEIVELINEELQTGNYEVSFDATNLPTGIYFYRMEAGNFVQTRKMILMK